ncbi:hypothetical protein OEZ86_013499 [Tetradesmus obliquus]|nr:hypothetical protein OEZ86_013499 [Tetradesmus obliquus]
MNGVEALAGELAEQERRSQLATPKAMLDDQANFLLLRAFIQEASNRSIVAGVQATLLLDLAAELCRDCSSSGADAAATDATLAAQTERYDTTAKLAAAAAAAAQLDSAAAAAAAAVQLQAPAIPVTASQQLQQLQQQQQARAARKQRFTREQQAAILESVERFYAACPSRYTELVIKHMQERFPGIEISNACVRKIKFRWAPGSEYICFCCVSGQLQERFPGIEISNACVRKIKFRANEAAKQNSEVNRRESQAAADAAHGLVGLAAAAAAADATGDAAAMAPARSGSLAAFTMTGGTSDVDTMDGDGDDDGGVFSRERSEVPNSSSKQQQQQQPAVQRPSPPPQVPQQQQQQQQPGADANPERYTHCVIRDMKEKYPDLELNMGQIRKIKFRTLGNINPRQASAKPEQQQQQQQQQQGAGVTESFSGSC